MAIEDFGITFEFNDRHIFRLAICVRTVNWNLRTNQYMLFAHA